MKVYRKNMRIINWLAPIWGGIITLAFEFDEFFPWAPGVNNVLSACFLPLFFLSPLKYFCGIVSLRITDKAIQRTWMSIKTCSIARENIVVSSRLILGIYCMIFSNSDLSHARTADILCAAFKRKAIIFPYIYEVKKDFPEWFL